FDLMRCYLCPVRAYTLLSALCLCYQITLAQSPLPVNKTFAERYIYIDTTIMKGLSLGCDTGEVLRALEQLEHAAKKHIDRDLLAQVQLEEDLLLLYRYAAPAGTHNPRYERQVAGFRQAVKKQEDRKRKYLYPYALALYSQYL